MRYGVILAGGVGTRLWPVSRSARPKQLLEVVAGKSLLQLAFDRLAAVLPAEQIFVCASVAHSELIQANLPELLAGNLIGEPCGRDTANAVGLASAVLGKDDPDATIAFISADQIVEPVDAFATALRAAYQLSEEYDDSLVALGIVAASAHTGLGYIERGEPLELADSYRVASFREKPDAATAREYIASQRYYWNSGMFVWRARVVLNELKAHLPQSYQVLSQIADSWSTSRRGQVLDELYPKLPKISIDYAVMEPAAQGRGHARVLVVELNSSWLDIGSWQVFGGTLDTDDAKNAVQATTVLVDSAGNVVVSDQPEHLIAAVGMHDMVVVHTSDVTMICPKNDSERIKQLAGVVHAKYGDKYS